MKKIALLVILIAAVFAFQPETARAAENDSLEFWCTGRGTWVDSVCTLTTGAAISIASGQSLLIEENETLEIGFFSFVYNSGIISNYGTVRNGWTVNNYNVIDNYGSFINSSLPSSQLADNESNSLSEAVDDANLYNYGVFTTYCSGSYSGFPPWHNPNVIEEDCATPVVEVDIDVRPRRDQNMVNCTRRRTVISVAILTDESFDALTVDHTTVLFEGASEMHVDRRTGEPRRHERDVDRDGDVDLLFHFRWRDTTLTCESEMVELTGFTFDDQEIHGADTITTFPRS